MLRFAKLAIAISIAMTSAVAQRTCPHVRDGKCLSEDHPICNDKLCGDYPDLGCLRQKAKMQRMLCGYGYHDHDAL